MPSWISNEEKWKKAKEIARKQNRGKNYKYITGIYKKMTANESSSNNLFDQYLSVIIENSNTESLVISISNYLAEDNGYDSFNEFVDNQKIGDCQEIVHSICYKFHEVTGIFGEIEIDEPYIDENGDSQMYMTHHWIEINGMIFDFSKGTLSDYINWDDVYNPEVLDTSRYNSIREYK